MFILHYVVTILIIGITSLKVENLDRFGTSHATHLVNSFAQAADASVGKS